MARLMRGLAYGIAMLAMLVLAGCAATTGTSGLDDAGSAPVGSAGLQRVAELPPPPDTGDGQDQPIAVNDELSVNVFQVGDLSRDVSVDANGSVTLPLIGAVPAAGKSLGQFRQNLVHLYGARYLQSPDVAVSIKTSAGQRVTVDGQVAHAGIYPTSAQSSLIQVIAQAGGLTSIADDGKVFVFRDGAGGGRLVAQYSVAAIRQGQHPDPKIYGGDVVVVFASGTAIAMQNLREALGIATSSATLGRL